MEEKLYDTKYPDITAKLATFILKIEFVRSEKQHVDFCLSSTHSATAVREKIWLLGETV